MKLGEIPSQGINPQPPQMPQLGQGGMMGTQQPMQTPQVPEGPPAPYVQAEEHDENESSEEKVPSKLKKFLAEVNIADHLEEAQLTKIGKQVVEGYMTDMASRREWEENLDTWTKMALQVRENKTFPWPKASNVKYPLLSTAAMQFSARAYPSLVPANGEVVKAQVIGYDQDGKKAKKAERVGKHMSYQIMKKMCGWEDDMDKLLIILPIVGTCFKKTYWDGLQKEITSKLILPKDLVINYWAPNLEKAERKTERIHMSRREVLERINSEVWLDVDLPDPPKAKEDRIDMDRTNQMRATAQDETVPYLILEQHRFLDLDEDGYEEPYIVTVEESTSKVLRISARFDDDSIETNLKGKVIRITPTEYYTKYGFIPNPDGGFYDLGFGLLLGTLNESVNTIINQLIDAGTLSNLQSGFIAKGLRIKMGESRFTPGEWKSVNSTADDLNKQIVPLPVREPSTVLFQLLGTLVTSAKELASVAEIFVGKMPGQNTPATTTMATIEQGMKVFTAIYKRVYRSLDKEFKKLYRLNKIYLDPNDEVIVLDVPVTEDDYDGDGYDICPTADPQASSSSEKVTKFQSVLQLMQLGVLNPQEVAKRGLEALEIPNPQELLNQGPPPPDPKQVEMQAKMQLEQGKAQAKQAEMQMKAQLEQQSAQVKNAMAAQMHAQELQFKQAMGELDLKIKALDAQIKAHEGVQKLQQSDEAHKQKLSQQAKEPKTT